MLKDCKNILCSLQQLAAEVWSLLQPAKTAGQKFPIVETVETSKICDNSLQLVRHWTENFLCAVTGGSCLIQPPKTAAIQLLFSFWKKNFTLVFRRSAKSGTVFVLVIMIYKLCCIVLVYYSVLDSRDFFFSSFMQLFFCTFKWHCNPEYSLLCSF